jgi:hypothetical protein
MAAALSIAQAALAVRITPRTDDVRFYPLPENAQIIGLGRDDTDSVGASMIDNRICNPFPGNNNSRQPVQKQP